MSFTVSSFLAIRICEVLIQDNSEIHNDVDELSSTMFKKYSIATIAMTIVITMTTHSRVSHMSQLLVLGARVIKGHQTNYIK